MVVVVMMFFARFLATLLGCYIKSRGNSKPISFHASAAIQMVNRGCVQLIGKATETVVSSR